MTCNQLQTAISQEVAGTPLFKHAGEKRKLKLLDAKPLSVGAVILRYVPA
jgi:hypothetical protein